jgi:hypothetical protein
MTPPLHKPIDTSFLPICLAQANDFDARSSGVVGIEKYSLSQALALDQVCGFHDPRIVCFGKQYASQTLPSLTASSSIAFIQFDDPVGPLP